MQGRLRILILVAVCAAGALPAASTGASSRVAKPAAKKRCHQVTKKVRGKTKRIRVCSAPKSKPKPKRPAVPASTADLVVTVVAPLQAFVGDQLVYQVVVVNQGPRVARDVTVAVETPVTLASTNAAVSPDADGACESPGEGPSAFRCRLAALPVNGRWMLELSGLATVEGPARFAVAARSSTPDPTPRNAAVELTTSVDPAPAPPPGL